VANISGARLRDAERELAVLKGESAVTEYLAAHPNETRVLQELVDMRRAGRSAPPLARVQRAMLWSDGTIEFRAEPAPERGPAPRPGGGPRTPAGGRDSRPRPGPSGPVSLGGAGGRGAPGGGRGSYGRGAGSARPQSSGAAAGRRPTAGGFGPGRSGPASPSGGFGPGPRGPRRGRREEADGSVRGLPLSGEGWALVREGEAPAVPGPGQAEIPPAEAPREAPGPAGDTSAAERDQP
jgi:hypothetical protein